MTQVETVALGLAFVLAPVGAAGATLSTSQRASTYSLLTLFASAGALLWLLQGPRIGLALLVTGLACVGILTVGLSRAGWSPEPAASANLPRGRAFRLAAILLFGTAAWGLSDPFAAVVLGDSPTRVTCALVVLAIGMLHLGVGREQGAVGVGLLTTLVGFEILYTGLEPALAVRAVLAGIMMGIALVTSVLIQARAVILPEERRRS
jgi:hypothetical protein